MPILDPFSLELFSRNPDQTRRFGMRFGALIEAGDVVCFHGGLGAGKTTLIQGIAQGWGSLDPVSSPTFVPPIITAAIAFISSPFPVPGIIVV